MKITILGFSTMLMFSIGYIMDTRAQNSNPNMSVAGLVETDAYTYNGKTLSNYSIGWYNDPDNIPPMTYLSGFGGIKFFTWTKPRLFIEGESGKIGINTVIPQALLHVNSMPVASQSTIRIGDANQGNIHVPYGASTGSNNIDLHTWRDVLPYQLGASIQAQRTNVFENNNALVQGMNLAFYTSDGYEQANLLERLTIRYNGNIGIGTRSLDAKLAVNGGIHVKEVKLNVDFPSVPDYVFRSDYHLMPINELRNYIRRNNHLPDFSSATEMSKEGIHLGEMNLKVLKKVEKLSLYLIIKDKEVRSLQRRISKLERFMKRSNIQFRERKN